MQDLKELIPEFYFLPDFFINVNNVDFGVLQSGNPVGNVELPPWASTPEEFIRLHRAALESDHTSANLHQWIDLIFGYRQQGPAAVEALNLFQPECYEGFEGMQEDVDTGAEHHACDLLGQCPTQLFTQPHAARGPRRAIHSKPLFHQAPNIRVHQAERRNPGSALFCVCLADRIVVISADHKISSVRWRPSFQDTAFTLEQNPDQVARLEVPLESMVDRLACCFSAAVLGKERQNLVVGSCGHWDCTWRLHVLGRNGSVKDMSTHVVAHHKNIVTAIAIVPVPVIDGKGDPTHVYVVTGSKDTTVMLWEVEVAARTPPEKPTHILFGHDDEVTAVAVDEDLDMVASVSLDGTCIVHTLRAGLYTLTIRPPGSDSLLCHVAISSQGYLVIYSRSDLRLYLYSINGRPLGSIDVVSPIRTMFVTEDTFFLVTGDEKGNVYVRHVHHLEPITKTPFNLPAVITDGRRSLTKSDSPSVGGTTMLQCISVGPGKHHDYMVGAFGGFGLVAARLFVHDS